MIISVFSSLFSIIVAFWAFSILDFRLIFGCVLYEGTNVFFQNIDLQNSGASYLRGRLTRGEIRYLEFSLLHHQHMIPQKKGNGYTVKSFNNDTDI